MKRNLPRKITQAYFIAGNAAEAMNYIVNYKPEEPVNKWFEVQNKKLADRNVEIESRTFPRFRFYMNISPKFNQVFRNSQS